MGAAYDVGFVVAESWDNNTTQGALRELVIERPIRPPEIDRVLLKDCAFNIGEQKTDWWNVWTSSLRNRSSAAWVRSNIIFGSVLVFHCHNVRLCDQLCSKQSRKMQI